MDRSKHSTLENGQPNAPPSERSTYVRCLRKWKSRSPSSHSHTHTHRDGFPIGNSIRVRVFLPLAMCGKESERASEQRVILLLRYKWRRMRFKGVTLNFWLPPFFLSILPAMLRKCSLFFPFHSLRSKKFTVGICYHSLLLSFFLNQ